MVLVHVVIDPNGPRPANEIRFARAALGTCGGTAG
jgi:hypothetical protein